MGKKIENMTQMEFFLFCTRMTANMNIAKREGVRGIFKDMTDDEVLEEIEDIIQYKSFVTEAAIQHEGLLLEMEWEESALN